MRLERLNGNADDDRREGQAVDLFELRGQTVVFHSSRGTSRVLDGVDLSIRAGETLGLVGESGSGKTVTALSALAMLPPAAEIVRGEMLWHGRAIDQAERERLRGSKITFINQEPMSTLDPLMTVGKQVVEVLRRHKRMDRAQAWQRAQQLFELVGIRAAERSLRRYPWEFSGGMAQRVVIAMALAPEPELLIADEPTTALDVTIQAQVLRLIKEVQRATGLAMLLVTHDLGVVAGVADRIAVMYAGRVVEISSAKALFRAPLHPYTRGLLAASPSPYDRRERLVSIPGMAPTGDRPVGCSFRPRCPRASERCEVEPPLVARTDGLHVREVACWHVD